MHGASPAPVRGWEERAPRLSEGTGGRARACERSAQAASMRANTAREAARPESRLASSPLVSGGADEAGWQRARRAPRASADSVDPCADTEKAARAAESGSWGG